MYRRERAPVSKWFLLFGFVVIALTLAGAFRKFRDEDVQRRTQREELANDLRHDSENRQNAVRATASVDLDPDALNLGELIRRLGPPGSSLPGATEQQVVSDLNRQAVAITQARVRRGASKEFEVRWAGISAEFILGDQPLTETDEPMRVLMKPQSYYGADGIENVSFQGSIRGIRLGDPVERVSALGSAAGHTHETQPKKRGTIDWGKWQADWTATDGKIDSLILDNTSFRYLPLS